MPRQPTSADSMSISPAKVYVECVKIVARTGNARWWSANDEIARNPSLTAVLVALAGLPSHPAPAPKDFRHGQRRNPAGPALPVRPPKKRARRIWTMQRPLSRPPNLMGRVIGDRTIHIPVIPLLCLRCEGPPSARTCRFDCIGYRYQRHRKLACLLDC